MTTPDEKVAALLRLLTEVGPWSTRNAAENAYCRWCGDLLPDVDRWADQLEHVTGCEYVRVVTAAGGTP